MEIRKRGDVHQTIRVDSTLKARTHEPSSHRQNKNRDVTEDGNDEDNCLHLKALQ